MSRGETYRTVSAKNSLGAEVGDTVKFYLPDMIDIFASVKTSFIPFILALLGGVITSRYLKNQSDFIRIGSGLFVFMLINLGGKYLLGKYFSDEGNNKKYDINIFEIVSKKIIE